MNIEKAISIAVEAHAGQLDKAGKPYIFHPLRVMLRMKTEEEQIVAVLHDVLEDSAVQMSELRRAGFSGKVIAAVDLLTHRQSDPYDEYVLRLKSNELARNVKLGDLEDNSDLSRLATVTEKDLARLEKYKRARALLAS